MPLNKKITIKKDLSMRNLELLKLPRWITKNIPLGEEFNEFLSTCVGVGFLSILGGVFYFYKSPFGDEYRHLEFIAVATIVFILILAGRWFFEEMGNLYTWRNEAVIFYHNAGNDEKILQEAILRLYNLGVKEDNAVEFLKKVEEDNAVESLKNKSRSFI